MEDEQPPRQQDTKEKTMAYEYVKKYYGVQVEPGDRVRMKGLSPREGIVARKRSYDQYVHVKFEGTKFDVPVHPGDLIYLGKPEVK
jgi:hypothetical protein